MPSSKKMYFLRDDNRVIWICQELFCATFLHFSLEKTLNLHGQVLCINSYANFHVGNTLHIYNILLTLRMTPERRKTKYKTHLGCNNPLALEKRQNGWQQLYKMWEMLGNKLATVRMAFIKTLVQSTHKACTRWLNKTLWRIKMYRWATSLYIHVYTCTYITACARSCVLTILCCVC